MVSFPRLTFNRGHLGSLSFDQSRSTHPTLLRSQRRTNSLRSKPPSPFNLHYTNCLIQFPYYRTTNLSSSAPSTPHPNQPNTPPTRPPQQSPASLPPVSMSPAATSPALSASGIASAKVSLRVNTQSSAAASTI